MGTSAYFAATEIPTAILQVNSNQKIKKVFIEYNKDEEREEKERRNEETASRSVSSNW